MEKNCEYDTPENLTRDNTVEVKSEQNFPIYHKKEENVFKKNWLRLLKSLSMLGFKKYEIIRPFRFSLTSKPLKF